MPTPIIAPASATLEQAVAWARGRGAAEGFWRDMLPALWRAGRKTGVDFAVLAAQSAKETGFGHWGRALTAAHRNTCGLKVPDSEDYADDDPDGHERFASWDHGAEAHANHLRWPYCGRDPIGHVAPRTRERTIHASWAGTVESVEDLGGKWALSEDYGRSIVADYLTDLWEAGMQTWCPFAERVEANRDGGPMRTDVPYRGVLHTTESMRYEPRSSDYYGHDYWPHFTAWIDSDGIPRLAQHIPLDRAGRALRNQSGGVQTNRQAAVQLEIAWTAEQAHEMPRALLDLVARWMRWVEQQTGVQRHAPEFPSYPSSYGATDVRMSPDAWRRHSGWCGHMHVPENDHGDPGAIDIGYLLEEDEMPRRLIHADDGRYFHVRDDGKLVYVGSGTAALALTGDPNWRENALDAPADDEVWRHHEIAG